MSFLDVKHRQSLQSRFKKALVASTVVASLVVADLVLLGSSLIAGGETRTIQLYHIHTGESLSVTYMQNGRYVPSAMKQINYLLRDWRKNQVIKVDPRSIDLVWELHEDLGSNRPIHIVCGYRSPRTNALLKRIGRNVAKNSQHMVGKAIDFYFPDVPTVKIRNSALVRQVGGVGYYRSSGGPTGFLHVDSGHVRHWGPGISNSQMAQIFRDGKKTVGRRMRLNNGNDTPSATPTETGSGGGLLAALFGKKKPTPAVEAEQVAAVQAQEVPEAAAETDYTSTEGDMAALSEDAASVPAAAKAAVAKPSMVAELLPDPAVPKDQKIKLSAMAASAVIPPEPQMADNGAAEPQVRHGYPIPRPRLRPPEILLMAAANIQADPKFVRISAASGSPPDLSGGGKPSPVADGLSTLIEASAMADEDIVASSQTNQKAKGNFAAELRSGTTNDAPLIKPLLASAGGSDINWWPQLFLNGDAAIRRDGAPALIGTTDEAPLPKAASLGDEGVYSGTQTSAEGKGDLLVVNREGKGNLDAPTSGKLNVTQQIGLVTE